MEAITRPDKSAQHAFRRKTVFAVTNRAEPPEYVAVYGLAVSRKVSVGVSTDDALGALQARAAVLYPAVLCPPRPFPGDFRRRETGCWAV
jgi:hypothetical protein